MLHKVFTVFDAKAESYLPPFYQVSSGMACRVFEDTVNDPGHQFHRHPGDFTLFEVGTFDDQSCTFELLPTPHSLGVAIEFKKGEV